MQTLVLKREEVVGALRVRVRDLVIKLSGWGWKANIKGYLEELNRALASANEFGFKEVEPIPLVHFDALCENLKMLKDLELHERMYEHLNHALLEQGVPEEFFEGLEAEAMKRAKA